MILDLFAGLGGVSQGLKLLGRTDVLGLDNDRLACGIAAAAGHARSVVDVYGYDPTPLAGQVDGLHGSPPCGGISSSGLGFGRRDLDAVHRLLDCLADGHDARADMLMDWEDLRSPLMAKPLRYVLAVRPEWVTLEQVPEAVFTWEEYAAHLDALGYQVDVGVVNATWAGVPQDRERAFLVAHRSRPVSLTTFPTDLAMVPASTVLGPGTVGFPRRNDRPDGGAYRARDMRSTELPAFTVTEKARSWTLVTPDGGRRQLTLAEIGRLQGFPADYPWPTTDGDRSKVALRIANAVPPPLYALVARQLVQP